MSFHPLTIWFQLSEAISTQYPALGAHVRTQQYVRDGAAHLSYAGGHCLGTHKFQRTEIFQVKFLVQRDFFKFLLKSRRKPASIERQFN